MHQFALGPGTDPKIIIDRNDLADLPDAVERVLTFAAYRRVRGASKALEPLRRVLSYVLRVPVPHPR